MKIPFGFHKASNRYIGIDEAQNGLSCNCICPECKMTLKARQGDENEHHFAHHDSAKVECTYSYWVSVRSMAKQIIEENGVNIVNINELNVFSSAPIKIESKLNINVNINPKIEDRQFDAKVLTSFGAFYIYFLTGSNDMGRVLKHRIYQSKKNTFSEYLVLEIDISSISTYKNKDTRKSLENLLFGYKNNKKWFSSNSSYLNYIKKKKLKICKEQNRVKPISLEISDDKIILPPLNETVKRMIAFYHIMKESYSYLNKLSENLTIIHQSKNLWYVSCCFEFFCISNQEVFIIYEINDKDEIIQLYDTSNFDGLDYAIKRYIVERDNIF